MYGHKSDRKIVVIQSDDWGSQRVPNIDVRSQLIAFGLDMESNPHLKFDTLESYDDLVLLEELLIEIEKKHGKKVKLTPNFVLTNPDFNFINKNEYENYHYKRFVDCYTERDKSDKVWRKVQQLIEGDWIKPQFHCREHINVPLWLAQLRKRNPSFLKAFELGCYAIDVKMSNNHRVNLMAAFEYENEKQRNFVENSIRDGLNMFKELFGYPSKTLVAPRYVWNPELEMVFKESGITSLQTSLFQLKPNQMNYHKIFHYLGEVNKASGLNYLVRIAHFEPAYSENIDWVQKTFSIVKYAFLFNLPAVISMHRLNFVGGLNEDQRKRNLYLFNALLEKLIINFPDVEFLFSDELSEII